MFTRHTETHLKLHLRDAQKLSKNDGQIIEKRMKINRKMVLPGKGVQRWSRATLGLHSGSILGSQSSPIARLNRGLTGRNGFPRGMRQPNRPPKAKAGRRKPKKGRRRPRGVTEPGLSHHCAGHSGYLKG